MSQTDELAAAIEQIKLLDKSRIKCCIDIGRLLVEIVRPSFEGTRKDFMEYVFLSCGLQEKQTYKYMQAFNFLKAHGLYDREDWHCVSLTRLLLLAKKDYEDAVTHLIAVKDEHFLRMVQSPKEAVELEAYIRASLQRNGQKVSQSLAKRDRLDRDRTTAETHCSEADVYQLSERPAKLAASVAACRIAEAEESEQDDRSEDIDADFAECKPRIVIDKSFGQHWMTNHDDLKFWSKHLGFARFIDLCGNKCAQQYLADLLAHSILPEEDYRKCDLLRFLGMCLYGNPPYENAFLEEFAQWLITQWQNKLVDHLLLLLPARPGEAWFCKLQAVFYHATYRRRLRFVYNNGEQILQQCVGDAKFFNTVFFGSKDSEKVAAFARAALLPEVNAAQVFMPAPVVPVNEFS